MMSFSNIKINNKCDHQKVWDLLPWYVNHSLDSSEQEVVKNHVKVCITCRIELNQQQQLFEKIQKTELLQQMSQTSFAQLEKRIGGQPKLGVSVKQDAHNFLKYTPLAASLLLLAIIIPFMLNVSMDNTELKGEYRTLANSTQVQQENNIIRIIFTDELSPDQIDTILKSVSGHIVKGPSKNGIYEVEIGNQPPNPQEVRDALLHLRNNKLIIFAELVQGSSSSE